MTSYLEIEDLIKNFKKSLTAWKIKSLELLLESNPIKESVQISSEKINWSAYFNGNSHFCCIYSLGFFLLDKSKHAMFCLQNFLETKLVNFEICFGFCVF